MEVEVLFFRCLVRWKQGGCCIVLIRYGINMAFVWQRGIGQKMKIEKMGFGSGEGLGEGS